MNCIHWIGFRIQRIFHPLDGNRLDRSGDPADFSPSGFFSQTFRTGPYESREVQWTLSCPDNSIWRKLQKRLGHLISIQIKKR